MSYLTFKNVSKIYGQDNDKKTSVIDNVSIKIDKGELIVFVGPSGCGKSTLLRMVAGLEEISEGEILLEGKVINDLEVNQRKIAMVFQDYALYPHMTVEENISFGLKNQKVSSEIINKKVAEASNLLGLDLLKNRYPKQLSGGQRQRVALARAIVKEPKVFLLDEPLSNLDAKLRNQTRKMIASLHDNLQATMIYVTHDQIEAMTLGDKIVVINEGVVQQIASPEELYTNPSNAFVANFIGTPSMNLFHVKVNTDYTVRIDDIQISLKMYQENIKSYIGKEVILGIRPEDIQISVSESTDAIFAEHIEFLGSENLLYFMSQLGEFIVKVQKSKKLNKNIQYDITMRPENVYLFDTETSLRINNYKGDKQ